MTRTYLALLLLSPCVLFANDRELQDVHQFDSDQPTKDQWIEALAMPPPLPTRGGEPPAPQVPRAAAAQIQFDFGSSELSDRGKEALNQLGAALTDERLVGARFRLEGHTDAVGDEASNLKLSELRASTVLNYLMSVWGLPSGQIDVVGRGETDLLDPALPESPKNRAVVVINRGTAPK